MELEFCGAAGEVTGSCHLLRVGGRNVLLDCGLIQGSAQDEARNRDPFPFDPRQIDVVVLSHAHLDHSGRLPLLVKRGFRGAIYAQEATCELVAILLADAARLEERDAEYTSRKTGRNIKPLFTFEEGRRVMELCQPLQYRVRTQVCPGVSICFRDAGHILGSAAVEVWAAEGESRCKLVFSGDLGQYDTPILEDPEPIADADLVLMESTYGDRRHRGREATIEELGVVLANARASRGNVLIPAFAIGRSQEILYQLGKHHAEWGLDRFTVFLDSPMAIEATEVYWRYRHLYDDEARGLRAMSRGMPLLPGLQLSRDTQSSMAINRLHSGAIIIAGSGMCNGGRIIHHLRHNLPGQNNHVVIVGYQAKGSLGRRLVEREEQVRIYGQDVPVRAQIHTIGGLSAHADQLDLARWYGEVKNRPPVWLVHGEDPARGALAEHLGSKFGTRVRLAQPGQRVDLAGLSA